MADLISSVCTWRCGTLPMAACSPCPPPLLEVLLPSLPSSSSSSRITFMGGGPRTYPGGVTKWQWKRMQIKREKLILKARLLRERQTYEARRRAELMAATPTLEMPWQKMSRIRPLNYVTADDQVKKLAARFVKQGAEDFWTENDGPERFEEPWTENDGPERFEELPGDSSSNTVPSHAVYDNVDPFSGNDSDDRTDREEDSFSYLRAIISQPENSRSDLSKNMSLNTHTNGEADGSPHAQFKPFSARRWSYSGEDVLPYRSSARNNDSAKSTRFDSTPRPGGGIESKRTDSGQHSFREQTNHYPNSQSELFRPARANTMKNNFTNRQEEISPQSSSLEDFPRRDYSFRGQSNHYSNSQSEPFRPARANRMKNNFTDRQEGFSPQSSSLEDFPHRGYSFRGQSKHYSNSQSEPYRPVRENRMMNNFTDRQERFSPQSSSLEDVPRRLMKEPADRFGEGY